MFVFLRDGTWAFALIFGEYGRGDRMHVLIAHAGISGNAFEHTHVPAQQHSQSRYRLLVRLTNIAGESVQVLSCA